MLSTHVVAKFGGTSVKDLTAMTRCANIIIANPETRLVVVSANSGVTNHLVALVDANNQGDIAQGHAQAVLDIVNGIKAELPLDDDLAERFFTVANQFERLVAEPEYTEQVKDDILAIGERFSSVLFTQVLRQAYQEVDTQLSVDVFDVRNVMRTNSHHGKATPNPEQIRLLCQERLNDKLANSVLVTQGFIGADIQGRTTTLGRGGSDYSAALLAEATQASACHIWTDVAGIYSTDPRFCNGAQVIETLSFDEAAEMATFGAKVLHPATILPASRSGIPVFVGSSLAPEQGGTWINKTISTDMRVRAVTQRKNQLLMTLKSPNMLLASGFLAKVFGILSRHQISVDLITTSEISVAMTLDNAPNAARPELDEKVIEELSAFCQVTVERDLSLIALIGSHIVLSKHSALSKMLSECDIRMLCHGASKHNLCFLVKAHEADEIVNNIHAQLLEA